MNHPSPGPTHLLAIDDDPHIRQLIVDYMQDNEVTVTTLPDGRELERVLVEQHVDLITIDVCMPGEDGMRITRRLRNECDIPIIMLTGTSDETDRVMGLKLSADD